jgi:hypothetical protein
MIARRLEYWLLLAALLVAPLLWRARGHGLEPGSVVDADLTLITADKHDLSCALDLDVAGHRCRNRAPARAWDGAAPTSRLQPFVTINGTMFLIAELFEQREIAQRYGRELPDRRARSDYRRFTARCRLKLLRWVQSAQVQFGPDAPWAPAPPLWVAEPLSCRVIG